jgi:hypothetical protein
MKEPREIINRKVRVFTCTPVDFAGDESFFSRESGMFCRGLRSLVVGSLSILHAPARLGDDPLLFRTDTEKAIWWGRRINSGENIGSPKMREKILSAYQVRETFLERITVLIPKESGW